MATISNNMKKRGRTIAQAIHEDHGLGWLAATFVVALISMVIGIIIGFATAVALRIL